MELGKCGENSSSRISIFFFFLKRSHFFGILRNSDRAQLIQSLHSSGMPCLKDSGDTDLTSRQWSTPKALLVNSSIRLSLRRQNFKTKHMEARLQGLPSSRSPQVISDCGQEVSRQLWAMFSQRMKPAAKGSEWMRATAGQAGAGKDEWIPGTTSHLSDFPSHMEPQHWKAGTDGY